MCVNKKEETIKISIVIPVYNEAAYLKRSLNALKNQRYSNIEVILVNDGSTDNSLEILKQYERMDDRFTIINKSNGGLVDATIAGIKAASGIYTCFLDPDDYVGTDFIMNYINLINKFGKLDFFATGFYRDNNGMHFPYVLKENVVLDHKHINLLQSKFLYNGMATISNYIFISRWNKMYKTDVVKKVAEEFGAFRDVSLGEDTVFTYIMLKISKSGLATTFINSYYYNVGNESSMMNNADLNVHIKKARIVYSKFKNLLLNDNQKNIQAYILYYNLIQPLKLRVQKDNILGPKLFKLLKKDKIYNTSINILLKGNLSLKERYSIKLYKYSKSYFIFSKIKKNANFLRRKTRSSLSKSAVLVKNIKKKGLIKSYRNSKFLNKRLTAKEDLNKYLPVLEKQIYPLIKDYIGRKRDLKSTSIEKNIFIFWWDGLKKAPDIVKACINSVYKNYSDYKIIIITKNNFKDYSKINKYIVKDFYAGKISIQTFSDILRFNLLYLNGGIWIDATIFFREKFDIFKGLENKSFESLCFNTSENFLKYKNEKCTWSGFFIASRKNGLLVQVMNDIFEKYYLKYHSYPIYFFIDAAFMIVKVHGIDDHVLDKVQKSDMNMFDLIKILNFEFYDEEFTDNTLIPQKLSWFAKINTNEDYKTNYDYLKKYK